MKRIIFQRIQFAKVFLIFVRILPVLTVLLSQIVSSAQGNFNPVTFKRLTLEQGLSHSIVTCIAQDNKGFMWFGTFDGLNKYDGYEMVVYKNQKTLPGSLAGNKISALLSDRSGRLWIGTKNGLDQYDDATDRFRHYHFRHTTDPSIVDILEMPDSTLLVAGFNRLYQAVPGDTFLTEKYSDRLREKNVAISDIRKILLDRAGVLWIATENNGLIAYNTQTDSVHHYHTSAVLAFRILANTVYSIIEDHDSKIWLGTPEGLNILDRRTGQIRAIQYDPRKPDGLSNNICWVLYQDRRQNIWIGTTQNGLNLYDKRETRFFHFLHNHLNEASLSDNSIQSVFEDRDGILWVGTLKGVNFTLTAPKNFQIFRNIPGAANTLSHNIVTCFGEDAQGNTWLGTDGGGLNYFDRKNNRFRRYQKNPEQPTSLRTNSILAILSDRHHNLWVGGFSGGLSRFDPNKNQFRHYKHDPEDDSSLSHEDVRAIIEDHQGRIWIATNGRGLNLLQDRELGRFKRYLHDPQNPDNSLVDNYCLTILEDRYGRLWIGTYNGLSMLVPEENYFRNFHAWAQDPAALADNWIYALLEDSRGNIWIGTTKGLHLLNQKNWTFTRFGTEHGFLSEVINGILEDSQGHLWLSTNKGLVEFNPQNFSVRNYSAQDGLPGDEFIHGAFYQLKTGEMLFGSSNGFILFHPDQIRPEKNQPRILLTGLKFLNEPVLALGKGSPLKRHLSETKEITLTHQQAVLFSLEFTALEFRHPERIQYQYQLEGYHDDWIFAGRNRSATFTNLDAGQYTFHVQASGTDGAWSGNSASIKINVLPPWWQSIWAYLLYGVLLLTSIWLYHFYSAKLLRLKTDVKIQKLEKEKALELEALKSQFFTNISHEFRTPLTLILVPLKELIGTGQKKKWPVIKDQLRLMQRSSERLLRLVNEIINVNKIDSGRLKLNKQEIELVQFIREILESFALLAAEKQIKLTLTPEPPEIHASIDPEKMDMVIYNLLSNAFKFTADLGEISIKLRQMDTATVEIMVHDTGVGIPSEIIPHVFERFFPIEHSSISATPGAGIGLSLSKELVERHGGRISLTSECGKGSCFKIVLPIGTPASQPTPTISGPVTTPGPETFTIVDPDHPDGDHELPRILIVEDDPELRRYLKVELQELYRIVEANNGNTGWHMAQQEIPDIILTDVRMPEKDGIAFCKEIKAGELTSHIPVILLTAHDSEIQQLAGLETGADDYIVKPFSLSVLKLKIRNLLETRHKLRERFSRELRLESSDILLTPVDEKFINRAIQIVEEHLDDSEFSVELFGMKMGLSRAQLFRKMKALTSETPIEFIQTLRLKRAAQLLQKSRLTVTEICYEVGFNFPSHFTKLFRAKYDLSPKMYRKKFAQPEQ